MKSKMEKGQILIILALAMVAIIGITALAVDGGMIYNERRTDQSTTDSAALAGAGAAAQTLKDITVEEQLTIAGSPNWCGNSATLADDATAAALQAAVDSALVDDVILAQQDLSNRHGVQIFCCAPGISGCSNNYYLDVKVMVTTEMETFFAKLLSRDTLTTVVESTARVYPKRSFAFGLGLVTVSPDCSNNIGGMTFEGGSSVVVKDAGVFSNSCIKADANNITVESTGTGAGIWYVPDYMHDGSYVECKGCSTANMTPAPQPAEAPLDDIILDPPNCDLSQPFEDAAGSGTLSPGNYNDIESNGDLLLEPGLYCLKGGFENTKGNVVGNNITLYFLNSTTVKLNNNFNEKKIEDSYGLTLTAASGDDFGDPAAVRGVLMYFDKPSTIQINGGSNNEISGTIYAPTSDITLNGGTDLETPPLLATQIIGSFIKINGGANLELNLKGAEYPQTPALIDLLK